MIHDVARRVPEADRDADGTRFQDARGDIGFALIGVAIITRRLSVYREDPFLRLRELIRGATAGFTSLEVLFHERGPGVIPQEESGGTYMQADPENGGELAWMGFDMVSRAILEELARLARPYGTEVRIEDGVGVVDVRP